MRRTLRPNGLQLREPLAEFEPEETVGGAFCRAELVSYIHRERYVEHRVSRGDEVVIEVGSTLRVECGQAGGVAESPLVGEPVVEIAGGPSEEVHEELGEVEVRIDIMPADIDKQ